MYCLNIIHLAMKLQRGGLEEFNMSGSKLILTEY